jgi:predicted PurR-regulated permease PerM
VLQPLLIAVFLFYAVRPAAEAMKRHGIPAWLAYTLLLVLVVAGFCGLGFLVHGSTESFRRNWPEYRERLAGLVDLVAEGQGWVVANSLTLSAEDLVRFLLPTTLNVLEFVLMTFFYLVFLVLDTRKMAHRVQRALAPEKAERVVAVARKIADQIGYFLRVKTLISVGLGVCAGAILAPFHLEYWLLWAFLFFLLNYITYVGSIVALVPPVAAALLQYPDNPWVAVGVAVALIVNRFVWIDFLELRLTGRQLNVDSSLLLVFLAYWGWTWGIVGLLLAVPMLTSLKIVLASISDTWPLARLMSEE